MFKNPISYYKLTDGSWDFDTLMDMLFSFFVLTEIPDTHPKVSERLPYPRFGLLCSALIQRHARPLGGELRLRRWVHRVQRVQLRLGTT